MNGIVSLMRLGAKGGPKSVGVKCLDPIRVGNPTILVGYSAVVEIGQILGGIMTEVKDWFLPSCARMRPGKSIRTVSCTLRRT